MFEDYLHDSHQFLALAERERKQHDYDSARRHFRASVFCALAAIEAFVNYVADSFAKARSIPDYETTFLNDMRTVFSAEKGLHQRVEYHKLDDKIRVLLRRFMPGYDFACPTWNKFQEFKKFRDALVHPRKPDDDTDPAHYRREIRAGLKAVIEVMNSVSRAVFDKPLRRKLLDLAPE